MSLTCSSAGGRLPVSKQSADALMRALVRRVDRLTPAARRLWDSATSREFSVGIQAGLTPFSHEMQLKSETLKLVARVGGRIGITTYAPAMHPEEARRFLARRSAPSSKQNQQTRLAQAKKPRR